MSEFKELIPPWIAFPDLFQGFPRWNQGFEEDYGNIWKSCFINLSPTEKDIYLKK